MTQIPSRAAPCSYRWPPLEFAAAVTGSLVRWFGASGVLPVPEPFSLKD